MNSANEFVVDIYDNMTPGTVQKLYIKNDYSNWRYEKNGTVYRKSPAYIGCISSDAVQDNLFFKDDSDKISTNSTGGVDVSFGSTSDFMEPTDIQGAQGAITRGYITGSSETEDQLFFGKSGGGKLSLSGGIAPVGGVLETMFVSQNGGAIVRTTTTAAITVDPGVGLTVDQGTKSLFTISLLVDFRANFSLCKEEPPTHIRRKSARWL